MFCSFADYQRKEDEYKVLSIMMMRCLFLALLLLFALQKKSYGLELDDDDLEEIMRISEEDRVLGDPKAPNRIVEYSSLLCNHCAYFHEEILDEVKKKFVDTKIASYVYRDMNGNKSSLAGATAAYCITKNDKNNDRYYKLVDTLYKKQMSWVFNLNYEDKLRELFVLNGVEASEVDRCLHDRRTEGMLMRRSYEATRMLEGMTPMLFVNGKYVADPFSIDEISDAMKSSK